MFVVTFAIRGGKRYYSDMKKSVLLLLLLPLSFVSAAGKPNIIIIMADDMGFSDIGAWGSEIPTPHLDALAAKGVCFRQFYNTGRCCPTRASLLTGLYSHQTGIGWMTDDQNTPGYRGFLNDSCVTIAEVLNSAGYFTAMTGKWHVGQNQGVTPSSRGFRRSLNLPAGGVYFASDTKKCKLFLNGESIANDDPRLPENWYGTDLWTEFGIRFIDEALGQKQPFFLYLAHVAPHFPLQADKEDIDAFRGKYMQGWDLLSRERMDRQIKSGLIDESWPKEKRPGDVKAWDSLSRTEKERFDHIMAVYAAVVSRMDRSVGTLVEALKERGVFENTIIVFLSDNGGNYESGPDGRDNDDPTTAQSSWFCGKSWAWMQNTPFREFKHFNHEGGIASPLIVHWPAGIQKSRWVDDPAHVIDLLPTCVEASGAEYPSVFKGRAVQPAEGRSLLPVIARGETLPERSLFWEHEGNAAVRRGNYKLVRKGAASAWELFEMKGDRTEQDNLVRKQPEKARDLQAEWEAWARRANVLPKPGSAKKTGKRK